MKRGLSCVAATMLHASWGSSPQSGTHTVTVISPTTTSNTSTTQAGMTRQQAVQAYPQGVASGNAVMIKTQNYLSSIGGAQPIEPSQLQADVAPVGRAMDVHNAALSKIAAQYPPAAQNIRTLTSADGRG